MGSVCRNRSNDLGFASIQTDGHASEFPDAPGNPPWGGTLRGPAQFTGLRVYLFEPVQTHCTAGDPSRQHPRLSVSIVSDPLLGEQVINR